MAKTEHYFVQFEAGKCYHVYNRSVDRKPMFKNDGNYLYFLKQYDAYVSEVLDTLVYCLLGNHFHLLVRIKDLDPIRKQTPKLKSKSDHEIVSHQFKRFFQSYAMAFNKQHDRIGTLFQTPFKRVEINNDAYFTNMINYIHTNPQIHGMVDDFRDWPWSSYHSILSYKQTKLKREEVIAFFGSVEDFKKQHHNTIKLPEELVIED